MTQIPSALSSLTSQQSTAPHSALNDLDLDVFLKLMLAELQNQDPLDPMDNQQFLSQISQIREVGATDRLTDTLDSVLLGQNITSATNLIGADVKALSDDNQNVSGVVSRVTIDGGQPKLHLDLQSTAEPSIEGGNVEPGTYGYRIVWEGDDGDLEGIEFADDNAVVTESGANTYLSVRLDNLPITEGPKQIYRTDANGEGDYRLVTTLVDGSQSSYLDVLADEERSETRLTLPFRQRDDLGFRKYQVSLNKVAEIRPPSL